MRYLNFSFIPLRISLLTSIIFIACLVYLNITVSEKYKVQVASKVAGSLEVLTARTDTVFARSGYSLSDFTGLFADIQAQLTDRFLGVYRVDLVADDTGKIMASTFADSVNETMNNDVLTLLRTPGDTHALVMDINGTRQNIQLIKRHYPAAAFFPNSTLVILVDSDAALRQTRDFSLLLFVISFFSALIVFFSVFLIAGKISMNIKQITNAVEALTVEAYDIHLPNLRDELGDLCSKLLILKESMQSRAEKIQSLEQSTQLLKDKKFEAEKGQVDDMEGYFCRVILNGMQNKLQKQKQDVRNEFLMSVLELVQDNITKIGGRILNFDGSGFLLFFNHSTEEADVIRNIRRLRQNLNIHISQYDLGKKFQIGFAATLIYGSAVAGGLKSGSFSFKTLIGETMDYLDKISQSAGTDDILIATRNGTKLKNDFSSKPLTNPVKEIPHDIDVFFLIDGDSPQQKTGKNEPALTDAAKKQPHEPDRAVADSHDDPGGFNAMLEDTFKS